MYFKTNTSSSGTGNPPCQKENAVYRTLSSVSEDRMNEYLSGQQAGADINSSRPGRCGCRFGRRGGRVGRRGGRYGSAAINKN
jgi:hypothetical protein